MKKYRTLQTATKEKMYYLGSENGKEFYLRKGKFHDIIDVYTGHQELDSWSAKHQMIRLINGNPNKDIPVWILRKALIVFEDRHVNEDYNIY